MKSKPIGTTRKNFTILIFILVIAVFLGRAEFNSLSQTAADLFATIQRGRGAPVVAKREFEARPQAVTMVAFEALQSGMSYATVSGIIGLPGEELSRSDLAGLTTVMYSWKNANGSNMNALFQNDHLVSKAQFGLRATPSGRVSP